MKELLLRVTPFWFWDKKFLETSGLVLMGSELFLNPEFFKKSASCKLIQEMANKNGIEKINLAPF